MMNPDDPYDVLAASYARHNDTSAYNVFYERPALLALLGDQRQCQVLDLGCGPGPVSEALVDGGATVTGVDRSAAMLEVARSRLGDRATFVQHDLDRRLPFRDSSFDTVSAGLVLHYLSDWAALLGELHRVLRPGGRLVASVHHPLTDQRVSTREPAGHGPYLASYPITDHWEIDGVSADVRFWHHPLGKMVAWLLHGGFALTNLIEPQPIDEMAQRFPESYSRLVAEPAFLLLDARRDALLAP